MTCIFYGIILRYHQCFLLLLLLDTFARVKAFFSILHEEKWERSERERERERRLKFPSLKYRTAQRLEPAFELDLARINLSVLLSGYELLDLQKKKKEKEKFNLSRSADVLFRFLNFEANLTRVIKSNTRITIFRLPKFCPNLKGVLRRGVGKDVGKIALRVPFRCFELFYSG